MGKLFLYKRRPYRDMLCLLLVYEFPSDERIIEKVYFLSRILYTRIMEERQRVALFAMMMERAPLLMPYKSQKNTPVIMRIYIPSEISLVWRVLMTLTT